MIKFIVTPEDATHSKMRMTITSTGGENNFKHNTAANDGKDCNDGTHKAANLSVLPENTTASSSQDDKLGKGTKRKILLRIFL